MRARTHAPQVSRRWDAGDSPAPPLLRPGNSELLGVGGSPGPRRPLTSHRTRSGAPSHGPERAGAAPLAAGEPTLPETHPVHRVPRAAAGQHAAHRRGYVGTGPPPAPLPWAPHLPERRPGSPCGLGKLQNTLSKNNILQDCRAWARWSCVCGFVFLVVGSKM